MTPHTLVHGQRCSEGIELRCHCGATFHGPEDEALAAYQDHLAEPALPSEEADDGV